MQVKKIVEQAFLDFITPEQENAVLESIAQTVAEAKNLRKQQVDENVNLVLAGLKKVEANMVAQLGEETKKFQKGLDGKDGKQGPKGEKGADGVAGRDGKNGKDGKDGRDGRDGVDGVSVVDARIDFDGSLVIFLSNGKEINAGEVVSPETAQKIHQITQHPAGTGSTSQVVLDTLASIQATIATYGTMATQNANNVAITGGAINGTVLGGTTPAAATFTTLTATGTASFGTGSAAYWSAIGGTAPNLRSTAGGTIDIGGSNNLSIRTNTTVEQLRVSHTASAVNYVQVTGAATGGRPTISSQGTDTNIDLALTPKGTGLVSFGTYTAGAPAATGYISIKSAAGVTYKVLVST